MGSEHGCEVARDTASTDPAVLAGLGSRLSQSGLHAVPAACSAALEQLGDRIRNGNERRPVLTGMIMPDVEASAGRGALEALPVGTVARRRCVDSSTQSIASCSAAFYPAIARERRGRGDGDGNQIRTVADSPRHVRYPNWTRGCAPHCLPCWPETGRRYAESSAQPGLLPPAQTVTRRPPARLNPGTGAGVSVTSITPTSTRAGATSWIQWIGFAQDYSVPTGS